MSLQEMGKKIRKSLKERYCDIVSRFINFQLLDDTVHSLKETLQLFAMAGMRNSYVTTVSRDMKAAGHLYKKLFKKGMKNLIKEHDRHVAEEGENLKKILEMQ